MTVGTVVPEVASRHLRDYQTAAVDAVMRRLARDRATYIEMPTGSGKTHVIAEVVSRARKGRVLAVAHTELLVSQLAERIGADGVIMADRDDIDARVMVASVQTLARAERLARIDPASVSLLVIDEAHHATANSYDSLLTHFATSKVLGVTATPWRADGADLDDVLGGCCFSRSILDLTPLYLSPLRWHPVRSEQLALAEVPVTHGDYAVRTLSDHCEEAYAETASAIAEAIGARPTLAFAPTIQAADELAACLLRAGVQAEMISGQMRAEDIHSAIDRWRSGDVQVLTNAALLGEGVDLPQCSAVIVASPTRSQARYLQMIGRGLRLHPDKSDTLIIDLVGSEALGDPRQVQLPSVAGAQTAHQATVSLTEGATYAHRASQYVALTPWVWREVPGHPDHLYAPLAAKEIALVRTRRDDTGLVDVGVADTAMKALVWQADEPTSPRRAMRVVASAGAGREVKALSRSSADWRCRPASERQISLLEKLGKAVPDGMTSGQAADVISDVFAGWTCDRISKEWR